MKEELLSAEQMMVVLDNAPMAIYVSAMDDGELLYANKPARALFFQKADTEGITCYEAAGFITPCSFCHVGKMNESELLVREFHHPKTDRIYQLSGKRVEWFGRSAHVEYVLDITSKRQDEIQNEAMKEQLQTIFGNIPCGLCVYEFLGGQLMPLYRNATFYDILGFSEEHIRRIEQEMSFLGVHPDDRELLLKKVQDMIKGGGFLRHTYRVFNDREKEYRWIQMDTSVKTRPDGTKLLYSVYSDVSAQMRLEKKLADANEKMQDIINAIPGGVAIYKVSDVFETVYFSDGVPELTGFTVEEYWKNRYQDASRLVYPEDVSAMALKVKSVIENQNVGEVEFREQHKDGHIVWIRAQLKWIGEEGGCPLLHCVFHNISELREAQLELSHLVNSIPGGIASYRIEKGRSVPVFFSDGVPAILGFTREEYEEMTRHDILDIVYEPDRKRVTDAAREALRNGEVLEISYRMRHKNGSLLWVRLSGRRIGPLTEATKFYAVFTGMSEEARLYQSIANETADGIYVVDKESYDLLYANESESLFKREKSCVGQKCYEALHGKKEPCAFCNLLKYGADGIEREMALKGSGQFFSTRFLKTDWKGLDAYTVFIRDITREVKMRKEKERLEQYFQTVVKYLPGGVAVVRCEKSGEMLPEFLSDGFAAMTGMTQEQAWNLYRQDAMNGVHPKDKPAVSQKMQQYIDSGKSHCEIVYRLIKGDGSYIWVKNTLSLIQNADGESRVYAAYHDMTKEREEQERIRQQYRDLILQHYRTPGPNALIVGHCNITQNRILEIIDYTDSKLLDTFGYVREEFFIGMSSLIVEESERQEFLDMYLNRPMADAFARNETEQILSCFVKLPKMEKGCYVQVKVNLVETPDTKDLTGILTVTDITEQTISDRILHQLSVTSYDFVIDLNLETDCYTVLASNRENSDMPPEGSHSAWVAKRAEADVVPKDRERYMKSLDRREIYQHLMDDGPYTFAYSQIGEDGDIRAKNMTVSPVDMRLGRVCLVRSDVTNSVREQQGLLNMMAYTFELMGFIEVQSRRLTIYTRQIVLENLSPYVVEDYSHSMKKGGHREEGIALFYDGQALEDIEKQFNLELMLTRLSYRPEGYDFVFSCKGEHDVRHKQINVLWGDENHRTICLVRADVTDMLYSERRSKETLQNALALAKEASQAKSDFLSAMSHDIRTPMNAIMGMTTLAVAHLGEKERVADCLQKIAISSRHLLSLINDILDMSKIERSKITLNRMKISIHELLGQLSAMMMPQAKASGIHFTIRSGAISHPSFYGDSLRLNQILINILSNAIKFTPDGGRVDCLVEETPSIRTAGYVRFRFTISDTGIGMSENFIAHIFEPFARSSSSSRIEGTGLGLSITKGLVTLMEGDISVESLMNEGSTFCVELEFEPAQGDNSGDETDDDADEMLIGEAQDRILSGRRFLIAEDNALNAEILSELLLMYGAESVVKQDGKQALQAFETEPPETYDAILMDIQMPKMNGYDTTRAIRSMERADAKTIPIIAMTANAFSEDVQAALEAGMDAHVAKPIDLNVLRNTLSQKLGTEKNMQKAQTIQK